MDRPEEANRPEQTKFLGYAIRFSSYLLIFAPAVLAWLYVRAFGVSVVVGDAWSMARFFGWWSNGTLQVWDFFRQHNEHRMFFPKGVEFLLAGVTKYNNLVEMYLVQACFLVTLVVLFLAFRGNVKSSVWLFLFVPVSLLVFSFRQYENMLFGFQINFAFAQAFGVLALFLLYALGRTRFKKLAFAAALGSGTIASFSSAQGLFVWPAGLLQLFLGSVERPTKKASIAIWGLIGLGEWILYFVDYEPKDDQSLLYAFSHPAVGIEYFLNLLGSSLFWQENSAFVSGLFLACLALASLLLVYKDRRIGEHSFWVSLLLYSFLTLALITLGRSGKFGAMQALASRYTSFSIMAVVSIYVLLAQAALDRSRLGITTVLVVALSGVMLLSAAVSYPKGIEAGSEEKVAREKAAFVLYTYDSQPDEALTERLNPRARVVRERAPILQELGYNVFTEGQAPDLPPPPSALSRVASPTPYAFAVSGPGITQRSGTLIVPKEESFVKVSGWAVDANNESPAGGVYVDIDGEPFPAFYGTDRQDVADSLGLSSYRYSGFERYLPVTGIGAGDHELSVFVLTADGEGYYQPNQEITLQVT